MKVQNMTSNSSGREVANQFIIYGDDETSFQSYDTVIATKRGGKIYLDEEMWDYSRTTGRYRNQFLRETKKETERKIKVGIYILTNLNK